MRVGRVDVNRFVPQDVGQNQAPRLGILEELLPEGQEREGRVEFHLRLRLSAGIGETKMAKEGKGILP